MNQKIQILALRFRMALVATMLLTVSPLGRALAQPTHGPTEKQVEYEDTFSGQVVAVTGGKVTVSRTTLGKPEQHVFIIESDTRIFGQLKLNSKATIGFNETEEGAVARLVVVRPPRTPVPKPSDGSVVATKADYDAIEEGMSYSDVRRIIGAAGEEISSSQVAGYTTIMYSWKNANGSNMNVMFQNDKLVNKAQFRLP